MHTDDKPRKRRTKSFKPITFTPKSITDDNTPTDDLDIAGLTVITAHDCSTQDTGKSIEIYMKLLSRLPLLTREQELLHAEGLIVAKRALLATFCKQPLFIDILTEMMNCGGTRLRRMFAPTLDHSTTKNDILVLRTKLLAASKNKHRPGLFLKILESLSFTFKELDQVRAYLNLPDDSQAGRELQTAMRQFVYHRKCMVEGNLRLVFHRAKRHLGKGLALEDLIQEGNLGLLRAIEKYDASKGFKFGTYATWWIDQALGRACSEKGRVIRVPIHIVESMNRVAKAIKALTLTLGHQPTTQEISVNTKIPVEKIEKTRELTAYPQSMEDPVGTTGMSVSAFIAQSDTMSAIDLLSEQQLQIMIHDMLSQLSPQEEVVLRCRFGLGLPASMTCQAIGQELGNISKQRVHQIECKALAKAHTLCRRQGLYL